MPPPQPIPLSDANWDQYLGEPRLYPNFLAFFGRLVRTGLGEGRGGRKAVQVVERYLMGGVGDMLIRSVYAGGSGESTVEADCWVALWSQGAERELSGFDPHWLRHRV